jgi:hypothetical protein
MVETINLAAQNPIKTRRTVTIQAPQAALPARIPQAPALQALAHPVKKTDVVQIATRKTQNARTTNVIAVITAKNNKTLAPALPALPAHPARKTDVVLIVMDRRNKRNTSRAWKKC